MAYYSGGTAHVPPVHHFQAGYGLNQAPIQEHAWPPAYYKASSYQWPTASHNQSTIFPQPTTAPVPTSIQPDPLPPHSHPAKLSPTQSAAFSGPMPVQPVRLGQHDVFDARTNTAVLGISREAVHMPSFLSSKPLLTVVNCSTNAKVGTIRFHNMTTSDIELTINGGQTKLSNSGWRHTRWSFQPLSQTTKSPRPWVWQQDKVVKRHLVLTDAKKRGNIIARMKKNILSFESAGLSNETLDEIIMTAVALAEHARRNAKSDEIADVSGFIADGANVAAASHSHGSHGGHHHGGYHGGDGGAGGYGGDGGGCSGGGGDGGGGGGGGGGC